ncbi:MAG: hypothetical protein GTN78_03245 [Gemmatimonadales bacterium]|nr:hypothetical protein [Gemmatimonadales bacterium]NIN11756.1 hypothetical protein [Gemmatimonadales bacterium]NIQ99203.1 hypothetical protein [Gemmatimonadales bacterium]NIS63976.1 hypothetical protein [Gemmatimonadales bacterium]
MRQHSLSGLAAVLAAACAAGTAGSTLGFRPTDTPLRYEVSTAQDAVIETPMGTQASRDSGRATVRLEFGRQGAEGTQVSGVFEAFDAWLEQRGRIEGGELIGRRYSGTLAPSGTIEITDTPATPDHLKDFFDPRALFVDLMVPLPPTGQAGREPWPVRQAITSRTSLTLTGVLDGWGRLAGDTTWNGQQARIILVEGSYKLEGAGLASGSVELSLTTTGTSTSRYVWDAERGVMLASVGTIEVEGEATVQGIDEPLPVRLKRVKRVALTS